MESPINIANYFLSKYSQENDITPMKLVKLVYISHGWHLGITGEALIDENPEAWRYGPVIPSVYHSFKNYGGQPIKNEKFSVKPEDVLGKNTIQLLEKIWNVYGNYSAIDLSAKTHETDTPWFKCWYNSSNGNSNGLGSVSRQIPDNLIKDYYQAKFNLNKVESED